MDKTFFWLISLLLITGLLFSGCGKLEEATKGKIQDIVQQEPGMNKVKVSYKNGTYEEIGDYQSPAGGEILPIKLVLEDHSIKELVVEVKSGNKTSVKYQQLFKDGIGELVVGKSIDEIEEFDVVNGSSLTPFGFQRAIEAIKAKAV